MKLTKTVILNGNIIEYITLDNSKYRRFKYNYFNVPDWGVERIDKYNDTYIEILPYDSKIEIEKMYQIMIYRKKKLKRILYSI